ncbi:erythroblast NAD(P)(+)--arginine ADP-ribosyltransferase-like [Erpetoichthys calabaricus]|uniref:erythroblast NAD(P)(+)--arginine ADP-ribosyltransferase-like n=1 Tax=Erpetoichthys calabaricus TaxID=27687 RepID=UPI002234230E|nr:erythroblast NAD(P)(+)--arginine ADP-ribosyltransferase-like [Erpetoichthys calabaricus]
MSLVIYKILLLSFVNIVDEAESTPYIYEESYDDDYEGCRDETEKEVTEYYLNNDIENNKNLTLAWDEAIEFFDNWDPPTPNYLDRNTTLAVMAYTGDFIYSDLNDAVEHGVNKTTKKHYRSVHFLLTKAIQTLNAIQTLSCIRAYRGVMVEIRPNQGEAFRFGRFASSSTDFSTAIRFGDVTFFNITTCHGADISNYSLCDESEVLIPPYEKFNVKEINGGNITLESVDITVNYRCVPLNGSVERNTMLLDSSELMTWLQVPLDESNIYSLYMRNMYSYYLFFY